MSELEYGSLIAVIAGVQHEFVGALSGQPAAEFWMDMNNNREGRIAGRDNRPVIDANLITSAESSAENYSTYSRGTAAQGDVRSISTGPMFSNESVSFSQAGNGSITATYSQTGSRITREVSCATDSDGNVSC